MIKKLQRFSYIVAVFYILGSWIFKLCFILKFTMQKFLLLNYLGMTDDIQISYNRS